MGSEQSYVEYICEQAGLGGALTYRKMFGEYALYLDGKVVALVCDNQLFVKPTSEGRTLLDKVVEHPPYPGAKPHWRIDGEIDDAELLRTLLRTTASALPAPAPKVKAKRRKKNTGDSAAKRR